MRAAVLFSGGKDSVFAAFWALFQGFEPFLLTVVPEEYSMMFHHPNVDATVLQAERMGLEHHFLEAKENEWEGKLRNTLIKYKAEGIVSGAVASEYQKLKLEAIAENLGISSYAPLWHKEKSRLLEEIVENFDVYITAVAAEGLGPELLGKNMKELVLHPPKGIHPFLEGGEGETFVADAPFFKTPIRIKGWEKKWDGIRGIATIKLQKP